MDYFCIICDYKRTYAMQNVTNEGYKQKKSVGSARSIVLYPHSQNCGAAYITTVS